jgi:hypothetical protein
LGQAQHGWAGGKRGGECLVGVGCAGRALGFAKENIEGDGCSTELGQPFRKAGKGFARPWPLADLGHGGFIDIDDANRQVGRGRTGAQLLEEIEAGLAGDPDGIGIGQAKRGETENDQEPQSQRREVPAHAPCPQL